MNDDQNQKTEDKMPENQTSAATPVEEKVEEIEAPNEPQLEAPHDMQIEATEEDGKTQEEAVDLPADASPQAMQAGNEAEDREEAQETQAIEPKSTAAKAKADEKEEGKPKASDLAKWYIVHTYSGHENKVAKSLHQRVESMGFEHRIFDIIVPTRNTIKVSQGKKENVKEKIFPGYVLVKMILDDESWLLVRTTQGVTAFIGAGNKPTPISEKEVAAIQKFMEAEEPLFTTTFTIGEAVKIVDGPFTDFLGTVDNIDEARGKIKVLVSIFGRETPVELDFLQVSKL